MKRWNILIAVGLSVVTSCSWDDYSVINGSTMGTYYSITARCAQNLHSRDIEEILGRLNGMFSTYDSESTVSRVNDSIVGEWIAVEAEFVELIDRALKFSQVSQGAFDITILELVDLWGFGPSGVSNIPEHEDISEILQHVGYSNVFTRQSPPSVLKQTPLKLDFSGIAKGFAVDTLAGYLSKQLCTDFLVDIGGEIRTVGTSPKGQDWTIGVENPDDPSTIAMVLAVSNSSIASSGEYRNYRLHEGRKYGHVIDPRTGWPVEHNSVAVTVVADDATSADALATAFLVIGADKALPMAERDGIPVSFFVRSAKNVLKTRTTAQFDEALLQGD